MSRRVWKACVFEFVAAANEATWAALPAPPFSTTRSSRRISIRDGRNAVRFFLGVLMLLTS